MWGVLLLGNHLVVIWGWTLVRMLESYDVHSGYEFPFNPLHLIPFYGGKLQSCFTYCNKYGYFQAVINSRDPWHVAIMYIALLGMVQKHFRFILSTQPYTTSTPPPLFLVFYGHFNPLLTTHPLPKSYQWPQKVTLSLVSGPLL